MNRSPLLRSLPALLAVAAAIAILLTLWPAAAVDARVGGFVEVKQLEVEYTPGSRELTARFHLASGLAITLELGDPEAIDRLFATAQSFAQSRTRLFVTVEDDEIVSWRLSIP